MIIKYMTGMLRLKLKVIRTKKNGKREIKEKREKNLEIIYLFPLQRL